MVASVVDIQQETREGSKLWVPETASVFTLSLSTTSVTLGESIRQVKGTANIGVKVSL